MNDHFVSQHPQSQPLPVQEFPLPRWEWLVPAPYLIRGEGDWRKVSLPRIRDKSNAAQQLRWKTVLTIRIDL